MIAAGNLLFALAKLVDFLFSAYVWIIIGSAIVSWVNADPWNPIVKFLRSATEPVYRVLRRRMPFLAAGGVDFTPMLVLAALYFLQIFIVATLMDYAVRLKLG